MRAVLRVVLRPLAWLAVGTMNTCLAEHRRSRDVVAAFLAAHTGGPIPFDVALAARSARCCFALARRAAAVSTSLLRAMGADLP